MECECHAVLSHDSYHLISESSDYLGIIACLEETWCSNEDAGELPVECYGIDRGLE